MMSVGDVWASFWMLSNMAASSVLCLIWDKNSFICGLLSVKRVKDKIQIKCVFICMMTYIYLSSNVYKTTKGYLNDLNTQLIYSITSIFIHFYFILKFNYIIFDKISLQFTTNIYHCINLKIHSLHLLTRQNLTLKVTWEEGVISWLLTCIRYSQ